MEKIITITFENKYGNEQSEDAIVEYAELLEEGHVYKEITGIYLHESIPQDQHKRCKEQAIRNFYEVL